MFKKILGFLLLVILIILAPFIYYQVLAHIAFRKAFRTVDSQKGLTLVIPQGETKRVSHNRQTGELKLLDTVDDK
jgi:hypothetical protein